MSHHQMQGVEACARASFHATFTSYSCETAALYANTSITPRFASNICHMSPILSRGKWTRATRTEHHRTEQLGGTARAMNERCSSVGSLHRSKICDIAHDDTHEKAPTNWVMATSDMDRTAGFICGME